MEGNSSISMKVDWFSGGEIFWLTIGKKKTVGEVILEKCDNGNLI